MNILTTLLACGIAGLALLSGCGGSGSTSSISSSTPAAAPPASSPGSTVTQDPRIGSLPNTTLQHGTPNPGVQAATLQAGSVSIGSSQGGGYAELTLDTVDQSVQVATRQSDGTTVVRDPLSSRRYILEPGPKGTVIRAYQANGAYDFGLFIEGTGAARRIWRMRTDGTTEPDNLTDPRALVNSDPLRTSTASSHSIDARTVRALASSDGCHALISDLARGPADYASDLGDALDEYGTTESERRVGRASQFLGSIWRRAASLCPDAPDPASESEFLRETALEGIKAIDGGRIASLIEKYQTAKEYVSTIQERARSLRELIKSLPEAVRRTIGQSTYDNNPDMTTPIGNSPAVMIDAALRQSTPARVYIGGSLACVNVVSQGSSARITNQCNQSTQVAWCFNNSGSAACGLGASQLFSPNQSNLIGWPSGTWIWYAACPAVYEGRAVVLSDSTGNSFNCSYLSR